MRELRLPVELCVKYIIGSSQHNLYIRICVKCMTLYGMSEQTLQISPCALAAMLDIRTLFTISHISGTRSNRREENTETSLRVVSANQNRRPAKRRDDVNWADRGAKTDRLHFRSLQLYFRCHPLPKFKYYMSYLCIWTQNRPSYYMQDGRA